MNPFTNVIVRIFEALFKVVSRATVSSKKVALEPKQSRLCSTPPLRISCLLQGHSACELRACDSDDASRVQGRACACDGRNHRMMIA